MNKLYITVKKDNIEIKETDIEKMNFIIGASPDCDLTIGDNDTFSSKHIVFNIFHNKLRIMNCGKNVLYNNSNEVGLGDEIEAQIPCCIMLKNYEFIIHLRSEGAEKQVDKITLIKRKIQEELIKKTKNLEVDETFEERAKKKLIELVKKYTNEIKDAESPVERFQEELINDIFGLGPLENLQQDDTITEIMVNKWDKIYIEQKGKIQLSDKKFIDDYQVIEIIKRIISPLGRRIDESSPYVDARLTDGSRVHAIIPPLAIDGPMITIRKFMKTRPSVNDLVEKYKSMDNRMAKFLEIAVKARKNIIISGGTGSGKTTLLNIISSFISQNERILTIEDAAELNLPQEHVGRLESRRQNIEGKGEVTIRDLVKNALRMRPDRIIVGECRGGEALDMLQAMNTGHDGSLTTIHANTSRDALSRLETLILMAGIELPTKAIRDQIVAAVDIIVQTARLSDGTRKIIEIVEVTGMETDKITLQDIFLFKQTGFDENYKIKGKFISSGFIPKFIFELKETGWQVPTDIFSEKE